MLRNYLKAAKNVFFPPLCFWCERKIQEEYLCPNCREKIEFLWPPLCLLCSSAVRGRAAFCKECQDKNFPYHRIISITAYKEPIITLVHLFKYRNYDYLDEFLSSLMAEHLLKLGFNFSSYHLVTSVPIHPYKLKERGYNQAALLAKKLANYFKIPFRDDIIVETKYRISQTKLSCSERQINVKGTFRVNDDLKGKRIILIDDLFTTGSTIRECALGLREKKAENIAIVTLSKAL